jgi:hypothetical protein
LQCASGRNWKNKTLKLPYDSWIQYVHWACNPIKAFSLPFIVPDRDWHETSREAGVIFDRIRILNFLPSQMSDSNLGNEVGSWVESRLLEIES